MESGYEGGTDGHGGAAGKKGWSEEQEDELRRLFAENQANPENDNGNQRHELMIVFVPLRILLCACPLGHGKGMYSETWIKGKPRDSNIFISFKSNGKNMFFSTEESVF